jgi:hypothetical protein
MKKLIYCECGWAGTPDQLEQQETINNEGYKVCPRCGTGMLPSPVEVHDETFNLVLKQQVQEMEDLQESEDE